MGTKRNKILGVTLISLLIGISLGAFLIVVMLQIFTATRANYQLSKNLNELDNVVRYTSIMMNDIISQAGYRTPDPTIGTLPAYGSVFPTFSGTLTGPSGSYNTSTPTYSDDPAGIVLSYFPGENVFVSDTDPDSNDKLWVKFQGSQNGSIRGCNDLYGVENTAMKVRFYSRTALLSDGSTGTAYYCEDQSDGVDYTYTDQPSGTTLVPSVVFDQALIRYGEDITGNGFIDRWSLGADVQNRDFVYAVRVALLLHTRDDVRSSAVSQTFNVFNQVINYNDLKIHRLYMFTILLPNAPNYKLASAVGSP